MAKRDPLLLEIVAWVAARGRITEGWKPDPDDPRNLWLHGICEPGRIHINPVPSTLDTVIHEVLHLLKPHWTERGVRRKTTALMRRMSDAEITTLWGIYQDRLKRDKRGARTAKVVAQRDGRTDVSEVPGNATRGVDAG